LNIFIKMVFEFNSCCFPLQIKAAEFIHGWQKLICIIFMQKTFLCWKSNAIIWKASPDDNHLQEELAKLGFRLERTWTYCPNNAIIRKSSKSGKLWLNFSHRSFEWVALDFYLLQKEEDSPPKKNHWILGISIAMV